MHKMHKKYVEKILRAKIEASSRFKKSFFLTAEIDSWLVRSVIFLKSTKISFSCHIIISAREVLLQFIPKVSLDSNKHFTYA